MMPKPLFRAQLRGPDKLVLNWERTCDKFAKAKIKQDHNMPFPVFIPSRRRAHRSNLNWEAAHAFGNLSKQKQGGVFPMVCLVVEPQEEEDYREFWPVALMLVLPENNRGPG